MKKVVIYTKESIFGGDVHTILAELADSLAASIVSEYQVYVVCPLMGQSIGEKIAIMKGKRNPKSLKFIKINYLFYPIDNIYWAVKFIEDLNPDILHVIGQAEIIDKINVTPNKKVYTFSDAQTYFEKSKYLDRYDVITCPSKKIIEELNNSEIVFTPCGLLLDLFSPSKGLLLARPYSASNQAGRIFCRQKLQVTYGIPKDKIIFMVTDVREGIDVSEIIKLIPTIDSVNGFLLLAERVSQESELILEQYSDFKNFKYVKDGFGLIQIPTLFAGADFCIVNNDAELGNFIPLGSSHYGCIPILSLENPNLNDDFTEDNSIIVQDNNFDQAIIKAAQLFANKEELEKKRTEGMKFEKGWNKKKQAFIEVYEN